MMDYDERDGYAVGPGQWLSLDDMLQERQRQIGAARRAVGVVNRMRPGPCRARHA